ncbi:hypothetical protein QE197_24605 (plasmid) [Arsenophonus nasoniae]|uniref:DUF1640 domain-containing protein n=1 Tax=Arsenophonus nasoniae TaxID=638 RepID=A0A4P7L0I2_9GAMM|nr:hypothetical protein [Arsenophonus nasoniae]QBY45957.1 hypothetical protein ArsFIN_45680 [Arsenophonus nasoniae]QBY46088.1 hypothetical protein ArsFIN_46990 [Arsenophonus nasoniae]QBY46199.1 hypothetical protein ArsFIN_48100 [Arsenophonus nasoniae]WGM08878.1 hypothetical protein QE258_26605 [Arsenophonus nasoniae]WGM08950.1 hypothetical protein QE258_26975 [Arsenophonus nasoniae]
MATITMNTHKAIKALQESGIDEKQAEKIVEVIAEFQNVGTVTKEDLSVATESIKSDMASIKTDLDWIKKLILAVGIAVVIAALKYIFIG